MTTKPRFVIDKKSSILAYFNEKDVSVFSLDNSFDAFNLKAETNASFVSIAVFADPKPICVLSNLEKNLDIYDLESKTLIKSHKTPKRTMDLLYAPSVQNLYVADKFGDVYSLHASKFAQDENPLRLEAGHLGSLTQLIITADEKYMITSDRDEKIRISNFPNVFDIWSFCLGHTEVVTSLCEVSQSPEASMLVSGSLDNTLKTWDITDEYKPLRESYTLEDSPILLRSHKNQLFVSFEKSNQIHTYEVNGFTLNPSSSITFESEVLHFDLYEHDGKLFLIALLADAPNFKVINISEENKVEENYFRSLFEVAFTFTPTSSTYISTMKKVIPAHTSKIEKKGENDEKTANDSNPQADAMAE